MTDAGYVCTKKGTLRAHLNINHKDLEETTLGGDSFDHTCTKNDALRMHKGVKYKAKLTNCDKYDYSCTKNKVPVMYKFRKFGGQEPLRKLCELFDFTCPTTGDLRFHQNAEHLGLEGAQEFKCALCDYTASKNYILSKHRIRKHGTPNKITKKQC